MLVRLKQRLTYANVVATLALFAALGGSAYAVSKIGSRDVKNRSLKGIDLRKNTLTGKEIRESKLGRVKRAKNALTAATAVNAANADVAKNADTAALATNSQALDGLASGVFEKSSRTLFGTASATPPSQDDEGVLFEWEGVRVAVPAQGGCNPVQRITLRVTNTNQSGADVHLYGGGSLDSDLAPESETIACSDELRRWIGAITREDNTQTLFFNCMRLGPDIRCIATRSEP